jgi:Rrf2 family nitric oxide-sensitive transcriptional repressor
MQLDKFTDYALRILVVLAVRSPERLSASAIAKIYELSGNHLSKVASELVRTGFVISERGRTGGLTLARPAEDISIGAVVRALKSDSPVVECFGSNKSCRILPVCGLRTPMQEAQEAFFATLDPYSLADVSPSKDATAFLSNERFKV